MALKKFPQQLLVPAPGTLQGLIFGDPGNATLFHEISIPLRPCQLDGEQVEASFVLNFIDFGKYRWPHLEGRTFRFKINPEEPYVDGCLTLKHVHNPVDMPTIKFGSKQGLTIPADLELAIAFEFEGGGFLNTDVRLRADLHYQGVRVDWNILAGNPNQIGKATSLARRLIDVDAYQEPEIIDMSVTETPVPSFLFRPK
jgi:hypothetical protein